MKKWLMLYGFFIVIFMTACSKNTKQIDEPVYRKIPQIEDSAATEKDVPGDDKGDSNISQERKEEPDVNERIIESGADGLNEFLGIASDYTTPICANESINIKQGSNLCLICNDVENDAVYYVNYGKDNYIYQLKDGISTLLIELEANFLQLWEGNLYFVGIDPENPTAEQEFKNIYSYNIKNKELKTVVETGVHWLYINSEGIFYTKITLFDIARIFELYKIDFNGSTSVAQLHDTCFYFSRYKDYTLHLVTENMTNMDTAYLTLENLNTQERILDIKNADLLHGINPYGQTSIYNDNLYYINKDGNLNCLNLVTGDNVIADLGYLLLKDGQLNHRLVRAYTEAYEDLFITDMGSIFRVNPVEKSIKKLEVIPDSKSSDLSETVVTYEQLFTTGDRLFAIRKQYNIKTEASNICLVELLVEDDSITERRLVP